MYNLEYDMYKIEKRESLGINCFTYQKKFFGSKAKQKRNCLLQLVVNYNGNHNKITQFLIIE